MVSLNFTINRKV